MSTENSNGFFEDDDEETWNLLVSTSPSTDVTSRLTGSALRFQQDEDATHEEYWKELLESLRDRGFQGVDSSSSTRPSLTAGGEDAFPAAFQTEEGRKHIGATASLLRVSEQRALSLTLGALSAVTSDIGSSEKSPHLQSLLGTRALLTTVTRHHHRQRLARLQVVAESLRMEQDESTPNRGDFSSHLDFIDAATIMGGRKRGLFRRLVTISCKPDSPPTRRELLPSAPLRDEPTSSSFPSGGSDSSWELFAADCIEASKKQNHDERVQAMEALLVLLYDRVHDGVHRVDLAALLTAFQSCETFFNGFNDRLCQLAGLICSECMALWRVFSNDSDDAESPGWVTAHPLLTGVVSVGGVSAERELEILRAMLVGTSAQVRDRRKQRVVATSFPKEADDVVVNAPESLALLSFGLLLSLTYTSILESQAGSEDQAYWREFEQYGRDCATLANDEGGAYDFLYAVMDILVTSPPPANSKNAAKENGQYGSYSEDDTSSATVAYASIGREVLISTISVFRDTILSSHHLAACENIGMLCSFASVIYKNHPVLCEQFWMEWELYSGKAAKHQQNLASDDPVCYLLEAAYNLAVSALNEVSGVQQQPGLEETLLPYLYPLLTLVSSLCSNCDMVRSVVGVLPEGMVRTAILCCSASGDLSQPGSFHKHARSILESVRTLNRFGNTSDCRLLIRKALEVPGMEEPDGPRILNRVVSNSDNANLKTGALHIIADLLESSAGDSSWALSVAKIFSGHIGFKPLLSSGNELMVLGAVRVLKGFSAQLIDLVFNQETNERNIVEYMDALFQGTRMACDSLSALLSTTGNPLTARASSLPYALAVHVLELTGTMLESIRPIVNLHCSLSIRSASQELRNGLVNYLASSTALGEAVSYFATAPLSLSLAAALSKLLDGAQVLNLASEQNDSGNEMDRYGGWQSFVSKSKTATPKDVPHLVTEYVAQIAAGTRTFTVDFEAVQSLGWIGRDPLVCLQAAEAAMELVIAWATHVDDMVIEQRRELSQQLFQGAPFDPMALSPHRLLSSLAVIPPIVRENQSLLSLWPRESVSNMSLIVRYLHSEGRGVGVSTTSTSSSLSIKLLMMCFKHARHQGHGEPPMLMAFGGSEHVYRVTVQALNESVDLSIPDPSKDQKIQVNGRLLLLRMLRTCVDTQPRLVDAMLSGGQGSPSALMDTVSNILRQVLSSAEKNGPNHAKHVPVDELRVASECTNLLSALWNAVLCPRGGHVSDNIRKWVADQTSVSPNSSCLPNLVKLIIKDSETYLDRNLWDTSPSDCYKRGLFTNIVSKALDIISLEISEANTSSLVKMLREMGNGFRLARLSDRFTSFDGPSLLAKSWSGILKSVAHVLKSENIETRRPAGLLLSFPESFCFDRSVEEILVHDDICSLDKAANFFEARSRAARDGVLDSFEWPDRMASFHSSFVVLSRELQLIASWNRFAKLSLLEEAQLEARTYTETEKESLSLAYQTCLSLQQNLRLADECQIDMSEHFVSQESGKMACALADLLQQSLECCLKLRDSSEDESIEHLLAEMLEQLHESSEKLYSILCQSSSPLQWIQSQVDVFKTFCEVQEKILSSAVVLVTALKTNVLQPPDTERKLKQLDDSSVGFVVMACRTIRLIEPHVLSSSTTESLNDHKCLDLLHAAAKLLALLVSRRSGQSMYLPNVAESLRKNEAVKSLAGQAMALSKLAAPHVASHLPGQPQGWAGHTLSYPHNYDAAVNNVKSIFEFMSAVADAGDVSFDMLSLLSDGISQLLLNNSLWSHAAEKWRLISQTHGSVDHSIDRGNFKPDRILRGYVPTSSASVLEEQKGRTAEVTGGRFFAGKDDPVHEIWRLAMRILQAAVRAARNSMPGKPAERMNSHYVETALNFLSMNEASLLSCLRECASVPFGEKPETSFSPATASMGSHAAVFTMNLLRECRDLLSLVSELCTGMNWNQFESRSLRLSKLFVTASLEMTRALGQFLGASGASRELFAALAEFNAEEMATSEDAVFDASIDVSQLFEGGIPNARHEAIRNAHYASRCSAVVTSDDYDASNVYGASPPRQDLGNADNLEKTCEIAVKSEFALRMEQAASECLFHAVSILWETHPASSAFVVFTPEELSRVDAMALVKRGMLVALRKPDRRLDVQDMKSTLPWSAPAAYSGNELRFARVLQSDTLRRKWSVRYLLSETAPQELEIVSADLLVAVEDSIKRKCVFEYSYAESASAIESARGTDRSVTIGHLILALRWCYQYHSIPKSEGRNQAHFDLNRRLAEKISLLLGTEVSLHREIGTANVVSSEVAKKVGWQLLGLFGGRQSLSRDEVPVIAETDLAITRDQYPEGRLMKLLDNTTWAILQRQIGQELEAAKEVQEDTRRQNEQSAIGDASPYRHRRSGLFRGLSL